MNYFNFLSQSKPTELGYKVSRDCEFGRNGGICGWATLFMTYGDGLCQHSKDSTIGREMLPDFLGSLLVALTDPELQEPERTERRRLLARHWPKYPLAPDRIRFALSIKAGGISKDKDTTFYYCLDDLKTSKAESKKHDRRWECVRSYDSHIDGSVRSAAGILKVSDGNDLLHTIAHRLQIEEVYASLHDGYCPCNVWEDFQIVPKDKGRHGWHDVLWARVDDLAKAQRLLDDAADTAPRWQEYVKPNHQEENKETA